MSEEKKQSARSFDQAIDALFSDTPSAPVDLSAEDKQKEMEAAPRPASKPAPARQSGTPAPERKAKQTLSISELQKILQAPKPAKPLAKAPFWVFMLTVCAMILSMTFMVISFVVAYFYFGGAILSQVLCVLFGVVLVLFTLSWAFVLRKIERGIREIQTRL